MPSAPDVSFVGPAGAVSLKSLLSTKALVLFFYPKDDSPGCTVEACAFRDAFEDFKDAGARVVGVSADSQQSHAHFATKHRLPFELLTDPKGEAAIAMGVKKVMGFLPGRVTFVLDQKGEVLHRFESSLRMKAHVAEALEMVKKLLA
jgi:thioredoxin-dependent peroxiredoxin